MQARNMQVFRLLAASGAALGFAAAASAQPSVINISGATLLENYVKAPASTNDFISDAGLSATRI